MTKVSLAPSLEFTKDITLCELCGAFIAYFGENLPFYTDHIVIDENEHDTAIHQYKNFRANVPKLNMQAVTGE